MENKWDIHNAKWRPDLQNRSYDTVVIAHGGCTDGCAAAWCFTQIGKIELWHDLTEKEFGVICIYFTSERNFDNDIYMPDISGKHVFIVDYSYDFVTLRKISKSAKSLSLYDHHDTTMKNYDEYIKQLSLDLDLGIYMDAQIDLTMCGAEITWNALFGIHTKPWFMHHVKDRDLWLWSDPNSRHFAEAFFDMGICIDTFDKILNYNEDQREVFYQKGKNLGEFNSRMVEELCKKANLCEFGHSYFVSALECHHMQSECGNILAENIKVDFAMIYRYNLKDKIWNISLRGRKGCPINLADVAKTFGGGGHPLAAGFEYKGDISEILKLQ